tara:strand:+ start:244 stop:423 length:180 start_codon:yes stop_codon:yes gene_type:complete
VLIYTLFEDVLGKNKVLIYILFEDVLGGRKSTKFLSYEHGRLGLCLVSSAILVKIQIRT